MGFQQLIALVEQYLIDQGIDPHKKFCCPDPSHGEKTPSANVWKHGVKCHGCKGYWNIFDLAHFLEDLPPKGSPNFFQSNIAVLAKRYGIPLPGWSQSRIPSIYSAIVDYALNEYAETCAQREGIDKEELIYDRWLLDPAFKEMQKSHHTILRLPDAVELKLLLEEKGFTREDMARAGIDRHLFPGGNGPIYPLWLSPSVCVGFSNKNPYWEPGKGRKYLNSPNNNTFQKKEFLYGLFFNPKCNKKLYVTEGQKDVQACWLRGQQAVSGLTSGLTTEQKTKLVNGGFNDIILAYDGDKAGRDANLRDIVEFIGLGIIPSVVLFEDGCDAYQYLVEEGNTELPDAIDGIDYYNNVFLSLLEDAQKIHVVIDIICAIKRRVIREIMCARFSEILNISAVALVSDVEDEIKARQENANARAVQSMELALNEAKGNPEAFLTLMESALENAKRYQSNLLDLSNSNLHDAIAEVRQGAADKSHLDVPFRERGHGWLYKLLHKDGLGFSQQFFGIVAADPHVGKSQFMVQLCSEVLIGGEREDQQDMPETMAIYLSTDDSLSMLLPRLISTIVFQSKFLIAHSFRDDEDLPPMIRRAKNIALTKMEHWINSERLVMKDMEWSTRLSDLKLLVQHYKNKYPDRRIFVIVDNLYRCSDYLGRDDNSSAGLLVGDAKELALKNHVSVWCTGEYRKNRDTSVKTRTGRSNSDLFGSHTVQYHAHLILHLSNDKISKGGDIEDAEWVHFHDGQILPRVIANIGKNKINGKIGTHYLDSYPSSSYFTYPDQEQALSDYYERVKELEKYNE